MNRSNIAPKLAVSLLALTLCTPAFAEQPPDNVEGNWTIYSTAIGNGKMQVKHVQIQQYGNRIAGYFQGPEQSGPIQGRVDVHHIMFNTLTRNVLTFRGEIYGDQIQGLYVLHNKRAPWQAVRSSGGAATPTGISYSQPVVIPPAPDPVTVTAPQVDPQSDTADVAQAPSATVLAPAPLSPDQLDSLVAPIALYPDALVAQVLAAATNPDQLAYADDWLSQNKNLTGQELAQAADQQSWDPSVKALTQFPSVMDNMAHNLAWTSSLGQAYANQQADVMTAVQTMRAKAQGAGVLQTNSQITVTSPAPNTIVIQPANPQVVYVPQYNPTLVYGAPVVVPFYVPPPLPLASVGIYFGPPITIGAWFGGGGWGGGFGWGWHAWGLHWGCRGGGGSTTIIYNHNTYINNHTWNNTNYNGYHPWGGGNSGYHPGADTHYGPNGAYHPNGYYGPNGGFHHDVPGTNPNHQANGGNTGNHGLIGGDGGVQHTSTPATGSQTLAQNRGQDNRSIGAEQSHSRFSGDGGANRAESNRGRTSMAARQPRVARMHAPVQHGGGGGRRR